MEGNKADPVVSTNAGFGAIAKSPDVFPKSVLGRILVNMGLTIVLFSAQKPELIILIFSLVTLAVCERYAGYVMVAAFLLYAPSYRKLPHIFGQRRRRSWLSEKIIAMLGAYVDLHIIRETEEAFDPTQKYLFGYAPHGWIPMGVTYVPRSALWRSLFAGIEPRPLTSTIIHFVPGLRDYAQHLGSLEATKRGFRSALTFGNAAMVVPGGQQEMIFAAEYPNEAVVYSKHQGFVRLALRRAAMDQSDKKCYLVPVYCFGESKQYRNPLSPLHVQKWCVDTFRSNFVFFPIGRYSIPSFPEKEKMTVVVGEPILVPKLDAQLPSQAQVTCLHRLFYSEVARLFEKYKHFHEQGYERLRLKILPPVEPLSREDFEKEWARIEDETPRADVLQKEAIAEDLHRIEFAWKEYFVTLLFGLSCSLVPYLLLR